MKLFDCLEEGHKKLKVVMMEPVKGTGVGNKEENKELSEAKSTKLTCEDTQDSIVNSLNRFRQQVK